MNHSIPRLPAVVLLGALLAGPAAARGLRSTVLVLESVVGAGNHEPATALPLAEALVRLGELPRAAAVLESVKDPSSQEKVQQILKKLAAIEAVRDEVPVLPLVLVQAYDPRLPAPDAADVSEIMEIFVHLLKTKLGDGVRVQVEDRKVRSLEELFASSKHAEDEDFRKEVAFQYELARGASSPRFTDSVQRDVRVGFLKQWPLNSLNSMMAGAGSKSYDEFHDRLIAVYHEKIEWLKGLRTPGGAPVLRVPLEPMQSEIHWRGLLAAQDEFDILITNTFILLDDTRAPFPHSVLKHAKIGGAASRSPRRKAMDGQSLLVNVFEELGDVEGIRVPGPPIDRALRNKLIGANLLAHEFGHAYFRIPDVYDHPEDCLMNSSGHTLDHRAAFFALMRTEAPCRKCEPYLMVKMAQSAARRMQTLDCPGLAAQMYFMALATMPERVLEGPEFYRSLVEESRGAFLESEHEKGMELLVRYDATVK